MPTITNAAGPAIAVGSSGLVVIRRFRLLESNAGIEAGLLAPVTRSRSNRSSPIPMRVPGFRVRNLRRASCSASAAVGLPLAGFLAETTAAVVVDGADFRGVAPGA